MTTTTATTTATKTTNKEPLGYSEDADIVTLRMTRDDFETLLVQLAIYAGMMSRDGQPLPPYFALANRLNAGNPHWTRYYVPE